MEIIALGMSIASIILATLSLILSKPVDQIAQNSQIRCLQREQRYVDYRLEEYMEHNMRDLDAIQKEIEALKQASE